MPEYLIKLEPNGEAVRQTFVPAFGRKVSVRDIDGSLLKDVAARWTSLRTPGAHQSIDETTVANIARDLTDSILGAKEAYLLQEGIQRSMGSEDRLSIVFELGDSSLMALPLELLSLQKGKSAGYLALDPSLSMERRLVAGKKKIVLPEDPVRILIVTSNPAHAGANDLPGIQQETRSVLAALQRFRAQGVEVRLCEDPTPTTFAQEVASFRPAVMHLSGHFVPTAEGFGYVVRDEGGKGIAALSAEDIRSAALKSETALCVLNGCRNSGIGSGIAEGIASTGEISVIGHQFEILDDDGVFFAENFYPALANGFRVREALTLVRRRMSTRSLAWLAPIYYAHTPNLRLTPDQLNRKRTKAPKFVGRRAISEEIARAILYDDSTVVNVYGASGIGKSALVSWLGAVFGEYQGLQVTALDGAEMGFDDLVSGAERFLDAAELAEDSEEGAARPVDRILIVDHWPTGKDAGELIARFEKDGPNRGAKAILVTSQAIAGSGVRSFELGPMRLAGQSEEIQEATQLFIDHWNGDTLSESRTLEAINEICRQLRGHPGLIESAASLANFVPIEELAGQIQSSPSVLAGRFGENAAVPEATLQALPSNLKEILLAASFFASDFSAAELSQVSGVAPASVGTALYELIESGLLVAASDNSEPTYALLAPVRAGLMAMDNPSGESHQRSFTDLILQTARAMQSLNQTDKWQEAARLLQRKKGDFVTVMRFLVETKNDSGVLEAFSLLGRSLFEAGEWHHFEGIALPALEVARRTGSAEDEMKALGLLGALRAVQQNYSECYTMWRRRAELAHDLGDLRTEADTLLDIGWQLRESADPRAVEHIRQGLRAAVQARARIYIATGYAQLAVVHAEEGENDEAAKYIRKADRLSKKIVGDDAILFVLVKTGDAATVIGDVRTAVGIYLRTLPLVWESARQQHNVEVAYKLAVLLDRYESYALALVAAELAIRAGRGKGWTYEREIDRLNASLQKKAAASGGVGEDLSGRATYELRRGLVRGLQDFLKKQPVV
ncbi:MAG: CHAT domain-containing protein [Fimbriimonadaceae bacterium]|nr:CHAT domain-containing protein [Fimbriimonadaceae bacterium]